MEVLDVLNWRYAAKRMNGGKVPKEKLDVILEAVRLAPTSLGLQPFRVLVVEDETVKQRISKKACLQPQILESSHLLVFAVWEKVKPEFVDNYLALMAETRQLNLESLGDFKGMVNGYVERAENSGQIESWLACQAYIAMGVGSVAAAAIGIDSTPMEGFDKLEMDKVLGLADRGLKSVVMLAIGYRDEENDRLAKSKKVRLPAEELFINI
ncbi:NAD(P)H-dependent oxidoreductase [Mangrovibacterium sp.]|uniref:NAD(P)H-dependent oxidoreductase n=1 Tax=Mangrovibacterium sp. TaxID=1961364 RepID=UPI003565DDB7